MFYSIIFLLILFTTCSYGVNPTKKHYLNIPGGKYGVSHVNLHIINKAICPDPNFNQNEADFSKANQRYCHEIMARVYYPTPLKLKNGSYYKPLLSQLKQMISSNSKRIPNSIINSITGIESYSSFNQEIVKDQKFPVIFFCPGLGYPVQMYENIIIELVSHGYIVFGINSVFISGDIELPNKHIVKAAIPRSIDEIEKIFINIQTSDLSYCLNHMETWKALNIFPNMDVQRVGALGHSIGGLSVVRVANRYPAKLKAIATLDSTIDPVTKSLPGVHIPALHEIAANKVASSPFPIRYILGKNSYLVTVSPSKRDTTFSYHMNFTDLSTLQYQPAIALFLQNAKNEMSNGFEVLIQNNQSKTLKINKPEGYLLAKINRKWVLSYFKDGKKIIDLDPKNIKGLPELLYSSSEKNSDKIVLSNKQNRIKQLIYDFRHSISNIVGTGNGRQISQDINLYLLDFFDMYLNNQNTNRLVKCKPLTKNTQLICGDNP